jgi:hypothetical protein
MGVRMAVQLPPQKEHVQIKVESFSFYRGVDTFLARPGRKQAAPVKSVMGRGMD